MNGGAGDEPVVVTGAFRFLGAHVAAALARAGRRVRCPAPEGEPRPVVREFVGPSAEWLPGTLSDEDGLRALLAGCRTLYHCDEDYRTWAKDPTEIYRHNVDGTARVLEAARGAGVDRVVYTSSVGALGRVGDGTVADETTPMSLGEAVGHYQRSKYLAERTVEEWVERGVPVVTVNPPASVGELDLDPTPVGKLILDFLAGRVPAYMESGRNFVDVRDVARGHLLAAGSGRVGERYILGGRNLTVGEFLGLLARVTDRDAPRWKLPQWVALAYAGAQELGARIRGGAPRVSLESVRAARQKMFFRAAKAERELGYRAGPLEPAIRRAVRWFRERGYTEEERG